MGEDEWRTIFDALKNDYRRRVLVSLLEREDAEVRVPEDVHVGQRELTVLQAELVHTHLPKLEAAGYIEWDQEQQTVARGPTFDAIEPVLALLHDHRDELPEGWI